LAIEPKEIGEAFGRARAEVGDQGRHEIGRQRNELAAVRERCSKARAAQRATGAEYGRADRS